MRSALVTILIVLQYAAQLPCRSVTRASRSPLRARPPAASSREDLETIITRNREITDLLIPLLEANLEAKRHDQNKRNDLLKVFPYRDVARKEPVLQLRPLPKRKSREHKAPLAFILASELRSRKGKKGRSKVHSQKTFLIQNENRVSSSEEDYEEITQTPENQPTLHERHDNRHSIEDSEPNQSEDNYGNDIRSEYKNQHTSNESDEKHQNANDSVKENDLTKESQEESDNVTEEDEVKVPEKNYRKKKRVHQHISVSSNSDEYDENQSSESSNNVDVKHNQHAESHSRSNENKVNSQSDDKSENPISESKEHHKKASIRFDENSGESEDDYNEQEQENKQRETSNNEIYKVSRELVVIDVSNEENKHHDDKNSSDDNDVSKIHDETDENNETEENDESHSKKDLQENSSSENLDLSNENVSSERSNKDDKSEQLSEVIITSEENKTNEDHTDLHLFEEEAKNQNHGHVTNENNISEPNQYVSDNLDVSEYHENIENGDYEEAYDEDEEHNATNENNNSASYEENLDEEHHNELDAEYENHSKDGEYENRSEDSENESDTAYLETEDDFNAHSSVEASKVNTQTEDDDTQTEELADDDFLSVESKKISNEDLDEDTPTEERADDEFHSVESKKKISNQDLIHTKKQVSFSDEIADKYAVDSKYTVENDRSLLESSELSNFNVDSVEGLIEVQQDENKDEKCNDKDKNRDEPDKRNLDDHSHVHKSYKLSFKFNK